MEDELCQSHMEEILQKVPPLHVTTIRNQYIITVKQSVMQQDVMYLGSMCSLTFSSFNITLISLMYTWSFFLVDAFFLLHNPTSFLIWFYMMSRRLAVA